MEQIRIAYIITGLGRGGAEMMLYRLLERLDKQVFQPCVITLLDQPGPLHSKIRALGIPLYSASTKSKLDIISFFRLFRLIKTINPTILQTQLFAADILGRIFGRILKIPVVITSIRNMYYGGWFRKMLIKHTNQLSDQITIVSKKAASSFESENIIPLSMNKVIYNGINPDNFLFGMNRKQKEKIRTALNLHVTGFMILCVASLTAQKGYPQLLKALSIVTKNYKEIKLVIVGSGPLEKNILQIINDHKLSGHVSLLGSRDDVPELMAAADALILSSLWEGLPGVVLEAMASELPVIATAVGGVPELVDDEVTGFLVKPGDPDGLAEPIFKLAIMPEAKINLIGKAARKKVIESFHVDKMVRAYEELYTESLRAKKLV